MQICYCLVQSRPLTDFGFPRYIYHIIGCLSSVLLFDYRYCILRVVHVSLAIRVLVCSFVYEEMVQRCRCVFCYCQVGPTCSLILLIVVSHDNNNGGQCLFSFSSSQSHQSHLLFDLKSHLSPTLLQTFCKWCCIMRISLKTVLLLFSLLFLLFLLLLLLF